MSGLRGKFIKGGTVLGIGQVIGQMCSLGRNIIIARLISPADFGIAAIFLLVVSFLEMISNLSVDRLLVQSPDGNNERFQQTAHFLQVLRGIAASVLLLLLAKPIAILFSIPDTYPAFCALASIPLLNSFCHLDPRRVERDMRFWPYASIEISSQILLLILAWPAARWVGDYRAMLLLLIVKSSVMMIGSHYIAERKYLWARDAVYIKRFFAFGWPLLVNGLLLFIILQGDRLIIGSSKTLFGTSYTMADVGLYSSAFMITMIPTMMCVKVVSPLMLPVFSRRAENQESFRGMYETLSQILAFISIILSLLLVVAGPSILTLFFGEKYYSAGEYVPWLALMWMVRMLRSLPAQAAIAKSKTKIIMVSNLVRMTSLPLLLVLVATGKSLVLVAIAGLLGEVAALSANLILNDKHRVAGFSSSLKSITAVVLFSLVTVTIYFFQKDTFNFSSGLIVLSFITLLYTLVLIIIFPWFKRISFEFMNDTFAKGNRCWLRQKKR